MTQFIAGLPNSAIDNNGTLKNKILNTIANKFPFLKWHGVHCEEEPKYSVSYAGPKDYICFCPYDNTHVSALNKRFFSLTEKQFKAGLRNFTYPLEASRLNIPYYDLNEANLDFAMYKLAKYAEAVKDYEDSKDDYFMYNDQYVRVYQGFIQIGNTIIPMNNYNSYIRSFGEQERTNIVKIIINISNSTVINNVYES